MPRLRATLLQFGTIYQIGEKRPAEQHSLFEVTRSLHGVTAEEARGFSADMVILDRKPESYEEIGRASCRERV